MANLDYTQKRIIADIAAEMNLDPKDVEEAILHQFKFTAAEMGRGDLQTIMLPRLGKFKVNPSRVANLNHYMTNKENIKHGIVSRRKLQSNAKPRAEADKGI